MENWAPTFTLRHNERSQGTCERFLSSPNACSEGALRAHHTHTPAEAFPTLFFRANRNPPPSPARATLTSQNLTETTPTGALTGAGGGVAQGLGIRLFAFGSAYWPLATAHSDPLWVRTCFGCVNGGPG